MSSPCGQCGASIKSGAHFCGGCGAVVPAIVESGPAVDRYRSLMASFLVDGPLDADETQQLETVRQRLALSRETHDRLLGELAHAPSPNAARVRLMVDVTTMRQFEVDTRCMVRLQLHNDGDLGLARVAFHGEVFGADRLAPSSLATIFPGKSDVATLWLTPKVGGFQELRGVVDCTDLVGERSFLHFEGLQFRVGTAGDAARVSVINIDQRSARVVDNSRAFAAGPQSASAGIVDAGEWHPVALRSIASDEAFRLAPDLAPLPAPVAPSFVEENAEEKSAAPRALPTEVRFTIKTESAEYQVSGALTQGELATLYKGSRTRDTAPVIVKVADDRGDNDLLQNEVRALQILTAVESPHKSHLPSVLDQFHTGDNRLGTVMEPIDGTDLFALRERLPAGIPERHIIWLLRRCLAVLGWAHSKGILHGNLDPAHILIRPRDHNVWLVDWCYAIINPAQSGQGFRVFNEMYSPPEVAERKPPLPSSDLYSLGKCMIFAAGGDPQTKTLPASMDERLARFLKFFVQESALGRARDAWELFAQADHLREELYGAHQFEEFKV